MYQYGGTIGPSKYPTFKVDPNSYKKQMLPRPVVKSRPFQLGHMIMTNCTWLYHLCQHVEELTINYLLTNKTQSTVSVLDHIKFSKEHVHPSLRICNTFFTQMIIVGCFKSTEGSIPPYEDNDDHVTALVSLGKTNNLVGGDTFYGEKQPDGVLTITQRIPFRHGNIQIGLYNNVTHGAFQWSNGERGVINFSLQKKILDHFYQH